VLSARLVPARWRIGLAVVLAWVAWNAAGAPPARVPEHLGALAAAGARETALGLLAGLAARFVLQAALAAGHLASQAIGIGYGALIDPTSGAESNAVAEVLHTAAQAGAVALGLHREAIAWLARSALAFPPGAELSLRTTALQVVWETTGAAALGARLAFPMLCAVLLGQVLMAAIGRTAPQLNLSTLGFSVAVVAGGGAFYLVAPVLADTVARAAVSAIGLR
jgi:flagellar biosynthetic protein FliR